MATSRSNTINNRDQLPSTYTLDGLACIISTGRSIRLSGTGRDAKYTYRHGIVTNLGDIERSLWHDLALEKIKEEGSLELFLRFKAFQKTNCAWLRTEKEAEQYALECFSNRLYLRTSWVGYHEFAEQIAMQSGAGEAQLGKARAG